MYQFQDLKLTYETQIIKDYNPIMPVIRLNSLREAQRRLEAKHRHDDEKKTYNPSLELIKRYENYQMSKNDKYALIYTRTGIFDVYVEGTLKCTFRLPVPNINYYTTFKDDKVLITDKSFSQMYIFDNNTMKIISYKDINMNFVILEKSINSTFKVVKNNDANDNNIYTIEFDIIKMIETKTVHTTIIEIINRPIIETKKDLNKTIKENSYPLIYYDDPNKTIKDNSDPNSRSPKSNSPNGSPDINEYDLIDPSEIPNGILIHQLDELSNHFN